MTRIPETEIERPKQAVTTQGLAPQDWTQRPCKFFLSFFWQVYDCIFSKYSPNQPHLGAAADCGGWRRGSVSSPLLYP